MAEPFIGEIRIFAGSFAPVGWLFCTGQLLPIAEFDALFALIGTTYGGDGQQTFGLPDLQGRLPVHQSPSRVLGMSGGVEEVTLTAAQLPVHSHPLQGSNNTATQANPGGQVLARFSQANLFPYLEDVANGNTAASAVTVAGGSQPHQNLQPYLCLNFIICLFGIFPTPN